MDMKLDLFEILREFPETTLTVHAGDLGHFARELLAEDFVQAFDRVRLPGEEGRKRSPCRLSKSQYIITLHTDSKSGIPHLHLDCNRVDMDNRLNSNHLIGIRAKKAAEEVNRLRSWKRTEDRFEENKARIKQDCLAVLSGMSAFS